METPFRRWFFRGFLAVVFLLRIFLLKKKSLVDVPVLNEFVEKVQQPKKLEVYLVQVTGGPLESLAYLVSLFLLGFMVLFLGFF